MITGLRTIAGVVCGYALMVVLITLVQETWLGGVRWGDSTLGVLAVAGLFTCVSAVVGAAVATVIARPAGRLAGGIMALLVVLETTALLVTGQAAGPFWFDALAALSLIAAILAGAEGVLRFLRSEHRSATV